MVANHTNGAVVRLRDLSALANRRSRVAKGTKGSWAQWMHVENERLGAFTQVFDNVTVDSSAGKPLSGLVFGTKDMFSVAGKTNGFGCTPAVARAIGFSKVESALTARLQRLGASNAGFTAMTQLALYQIAPIAHPLDAKRTAGGSSTGSAVAVAHGLVDFALGSQTGGSTVRPAAFNGCVGFKPSFGVLPTAGMMSVSPNLDTAGLLARSVIDTRVIFEALVGVVSETKAFPTPSSSLLSALKVGIFYSVNNPYGESCEEPSAACVALFEQLLIKMGVQVRRVPFPKSFSHEKCLKLANFEAGKNLEGLLQDKDMVESSLGREFTERLTAMRALPFDVYTEARAMQITSSLEMDLVFEQVDLVLAPSAKNVAPLLDDCLPSDFPSGDPWINCALTSFGVPALHLPIADCTKTGMPVGVQLIGPRLSDVRLLCLAQTLLEQMAKQPKQV